MRSRGRRRPTCVVSHPGIIADEAQRGETGRRRTLQGGRAVVGLDFQDPAIGASQAGVFLNLIPVFTAVISVMLGEKITGSQVWGGMLVFAGVYLTTGMLDQKCRAAKKEIA